MEDQSQSKNVFVVSRREKIRGEMKEKDRERGVPETE